MASWILASYLLITETNFDKSREKYIANLVSKQVSEFIASRLAVLHGLQLRLEGFEEITERNFSDEAKIVHEIFSEFLGINFIDPERIIRIVTPLEPNLAALGRKAGLTQNILDIIEKARDKRIPTSTPPVDLFQGGLGVAIYYPIFRAGNFSGYLNAVIRLPEFWKKGLLDLPADVAIQISDGEKNIASAGEITRKALEETSISFLDRVWIIRAELPYSTFDTYRSEFVGLIATVVTIISFAAAAMQWRLISQRNQLKNTNRYFREFTEIATDWVWEIGEDKKFKLIAAGSPNLKWHSSSRAGDSVSSISGYNLADPSWKKMDDCVNNRQVFRNILVKIPNPDDPSRPRYLHVSGRPLFEGDGTYIGFRGISRDVTENHLAQEKLRLLSVALEHSPASIIITDHEAKISYVNKTFEKVTGYSLDEVIGQSPTMLRSGLVSKETYRGLWQTIGGGSIWVGDLVNRKKDGTIYWDSVSIAPVRDENGVISQYVSVQTDITERKELEERLNSAKVTAEATDFAKSQFLANMSHELRTPLNAIIGFSEVISRQAFGVAESKYVEYANDILGSGRYLLQIINDVLDMSRIEAGGRDLHLAKAQLKDLVDACVRLIKDRAVEKNIELIVVARKNWPEVSIDVTALKQILLNLLSNAVKFTPSGGRVSLSVAAKANREIEISVKDNGVGIADGEIKNLFKPFWRGEGVYSRRQEGSGLGLAISQRLAEMHGGLITVESALGVGTTMTLRLPASCLSTYDGADSTGQNSGKSANSDKVVAA